MKLNDTTSSMQIVQQLDNKLQQLNSTSNEIAIQRLKSIDVK